MSCASPAGAADCPVSPDPAYLRSLGLRSILRSTALIKDSRLKRSAQQLDTANRAAARLRACNSHLFLSVKFQFRNRRFTAFVSYMGIFGPPKWTISTVLHAASRWAIN